MTRTLDTGQQTYDLLRQAQEGAYRLPADLGGFAATLRCSASGGWMPASVRAQAPWAVDGGTERREPRLCGHVLLGAAAP